ncbi:hypothetical protein [Sphingomonas sp. VNH70]|uniref:hypothetical protein n=1 Tax=Sphingomonas silueang TaxID=3156617 RepID=UPI0032B4ABBF
MLDDNDHIEAIFLVARHGRAAPEVAGRHCSQAADRGDRDEAKRWRTIRRFIRRSMAGPELSVRIR